MIKVCVDLNVIEAINFNRLNHYAVSDEGFVPLLSNLLPDECISFDWRIFLFDHECLVFGDSYETS